MNTQIVTVEDTNQAGTLTLPNGGSGGSQTNGGGEQTNGSGSSSSPSSSSPNNPNDDRGALDVDLPPSIGGTFQIVAKAGRNQTVVANDQGIGVKQADGSIRIAAGDEIEFRFPRPLLITRMKLGDWDDIGDRAVYSSSSYLNRKKFLFESKKYHIF